MRHTLVLGTVLTLAAALLAPIPEARAADTSAPSGAQAPSVDPRDADGKFSLAIYPDTQGETTDSRDQRFLKRSEYIVKLKDLRDYRFAIHSGDVVNWGWLVPSQYQIASQAMAPLEKAGIPYSIALGNHDTRAVGWSGVGNEYGGGAYANNPECVQRLGAAECDTRKLVRHTEEFNQTFVVSRYRNVISSWEPKKIENLYSTFEAGGKKWLVLALELWPRAGAIAWANSVVSSHRGHNVIVVTHSYLNSDASIGTSNGGYGANSPKYVYDNLISKHSNIKMVFSGHNGSSAQRVDTPAGNKVVSFLQCMHAPAPQAPYRTVEIDVKNGKIATAMVDAITGMNKVNYIYTGMKFV